jgi:AmmeMemoRadiSam system protein B
VDFIAENEVTIFILARSPVCRIFAAVLFIVTMTLLAFGCNSDHGSGEGHQSYFLDSHYSVFSDRPGFFEDAIATARKHIGNQRRISPDSAGTVRWGIVSHHLLIRDLIAEFFLRLSWEVHPKTIVVIGPNHFSEGHHTVAVSRLPWKTPFGIMNSNQEIVNALVDSGVASVDEEAFTREHSVGALVPFLKYFFPEASVVTIDLRAHTDTIEAAHLAAFLSSFADRGVFLLASLDFSHYKTSSAAEKEDRTTLEIIRNFDTKNCRRAFVDSRAALFAVLKSCTEIGSTSIEIIHHTNSGIIENNPIAPCTSYINALMRSAR